MKIVQYNDYIAIKFKQRKNKKNIKELKVDFKFINQRKTDIIVCAEKRQNKYKVIELLLAPELSDQDIYDICQLYWYVIPTTNKGKKLPPIIGIWEFSGNISVVACLKTKKSKPLKHQVKE